MRLLDSSSGGCVMSGRQQSAGGAASSSERSHRATSVPNPVNAGKTLLETAATAGRQGTSTLHALLEPFSSSHGKIPESSRAGADIAVQKTANQIGLLESWKYLPFLAHQATSLASAFVNHHVFGPPKKSWGIELTLFTTAVRESVQYSHLASVDMMRKFLNLGQVLPTPGDGVVTPVTFRVKKRGLPGLLEEADAAENGSRKLTGEWVVSKRIWRRMQKEHYGTPSRAGHSPSSSRKGSAAPNPAREHAQWHAHSGKDKVILYLHGGAYYVMSAATHRFITISTSKYTDCRVFAVNYRLAPECRWPGQIHDAVSGYYRLTHDLKIPPENIIFAGDSAGGGLCLAVLLYLRDNNLPLPCGAILMSPWVDLTMSCDSWETNAPYDYLRMPSGDDHMNPIASLLGAENVKRLITHPYVSPLFGDFTGFPPLLIQCGDAECLRDEGTLLAHKASLAGVQVYHEVYEDCPHVFQALFFLEAAKKAFRSHRNFVKRVLPSIRRSSRMMLDSMDREVMSDAHAIKQDGEPEAQSLPASPGLGNIGETGSESDEEETELDSPDDLSGETSHTSIPSESSSTGEERRQTELQEGDTLSNGVLKAVGGMVNIATKISPTQHHDLDRVDEEQDENIADMESEAGESESRHSRYYSAASYQRTPTPSVPSSPSMRLRQRSLSSLSITSLTSGSAPSPYATPSASPYPTLHRPSHSRTQSGSTIRPGIMRQNSRPRARSGSHPDLQALLDSYDAAPMRNTILFSAEDTAEGSDMETDPQMSR